MVAAFLPAIVACGGEASPDATAGTALDASACDTLLACAESREPGELAALEADYGDCADASCVSACVEELGRLQAAYPEADLCFDTVGAVSGCPFTQGSWSQEVARDADSCSFDEMALGQYVTYTCTDPATGAFALGNSLVPLTCAMGDERAFSCTGSDEEEVAFDGIFDQRGEAAQGTWTVTYSSGMCEASGSFEQGYLSG
jgi:hypothetical protein